MTAVETYQVSDTVRIVVEYDQSPTNPRQDWYMITGALTVNGARNTIDVEPVHEFPGDLKRASDELLTTQRIQRWARIFHGITVVHNDGTLWWADAEQMQANWPDLEQGSPEYVAKEIEVIESEWASYRYWAEGSVYGVIVQRAEVYTRTVDGVITNPDDTITTWTEVESVWGVYFENEYPTEEEVRDCAAGITPDLVSGTV